MTWDEPDLLQNVKRVNPWLIEMVSNMSTMHISPLSPPRKKLRVPQPPDFPPISSLIANNNIPASIQGARHNSSQFALNNNHHPEFNKIQNLPYGMLNNDPLRRVSSKTLEPTKETNEKENDSCLLTMGKPSLKKTEDNKKDKRKPVFMLFGTPILTEQQLSESWSGDGSVVLQNGPVETSSDEAGPWSSEQKSEFGLETSHCKVLTES